MSNESYAKENVILGAVRSILVADNANTGLDVREIHYHCSDRIHPKGLNEKIDKPNIFIEVDQINTEAGLPSGEYLLEVSITHDMTVSEFNIVINNIAARVLFLLDKRPDSMNSALSSSYKLRCRIIRKTSSNFSRDESTKIITKFIYFRVKCDDEVID